MITLKAERTGGNCYLKEEVNGAEVLELSTGIDFFSVNEGKNAQKVWIDCWVKTKNLFDGIRLTEKAKIYNANYKMIAKVLQSFNPMQLLEIKDSMQHILLSGIIDNSCIDKDFVPETDLSNLLLKISENEKIEYFEKFLDKFSFQKQIENNKYTSFSIYEPNFTTQTLHPRILMIFYNNELIAIFHTRKVDVKLYDSIEMGSEYKMIYNSKFTEHTKNEMVAIYKKKFNQSNKKSNE